MSDKVCDHFEDVSEFDVLLDQAELGARSEHECEFVEGLREKFDQWGDRTFLSDAQLEWLHRLAER